MRIRQTCVSMVMVSGICLFAGCAFLADKPQGGAQIDSTTLGTESKSLAGAYRDIGSDGSIKPHFESSYKMSEEPETQTGAITLGGPVDIPDLKTGTMKKSTGGTAPGSGSGSNSTGSSRGASGAGGR